MTGAAAALVGVGSVAAFTVSVPPTTTGSNSGAASSGTVTSGSAAATVSGGTAAFTYLWSYVSGNASITITSPTASSTTFSATVSNFTTPKEAYFKVKVTDSLGHTTESSPMLVSLDWTDTR